MPNQNTDDEKPWRDEETLREEYVHKQRPSTELAEEWGCDHSTVSTWVSKYGFNKYSRLPKFTLSTRKTEEPPDGSRKINASYETYDFKDGNRSTDIVHHHRLLAVAEWGLDVVCDMDVHHQNNIPWDNRPENLELLTKAEHAQEHSGTEMVDGEPWYAEDNLRRLYHELEWSTAKIAEKYDVGKSSVRDHMEKHGIERRSLSESQRLRYQDGQQQTLDAFVGDD